MHTNRTILPHRKYLALQSVTVFVTVFFISRPFLATFFESDSQATRLQATTNLFLIGLPLITISLALGYFRVFEKLKRYAFLKTLILAMGGSGGSLIGLALLLFLLRYF